MEDQSASRLVPTALVESTIHEEFPVIDKKSYIDRSIDKIVPAVIFPESTDLEGVTSLEFVIHQSSEHYIDLSSIEIELKLTLLDGDGIRDGIQADTKVYFINDLLQAFFPTRKIYINNTALESCYHGSHVSRLKHLLNTPNDICENRGKILGAFPIKASLMKNKIDGGLMANHATRIAFSKQDTIHMTGPLNLDISSASKWLLDRCDVRLILEPSRSKFCINAVDGAVAFKYAIKMARLHVNKIKPSPGGFINTTKSLLSNNMEYIMKRNVVKTEILAAGQSSLVFVRPFQNRIPAKLYLFMTKQEADNGSYSLDPFYYEHNNLINYKVLIDGIPLIDSDCSASDGMIKVYHDSLKAHGAEFHFIPEEIYTKGGFVICISTNHSDVDELSFEQKGNMSIHLKFQNVMASTQIVYLIGVVHSSFEITSDREVLSNFSY